jgi:hypothetical protein
MKEIKTTQYIIIGLLVIIIIGGLKNNQMLNDKKN